MLLSVVWWSYLTCGVALTQNKRNGFHSAGAHTPPAPVREETKSLKEDARRALQHAVEHRPRVDAGARGQRRSMLGGAESAVAALVGASSGVKMMRWSALLNGGHEELSVHGVHQAARASRGRSGSPKVRVCTRLACGFWPAGRHSLPDGSEVWITVACIERRFFFALEFIREQTNTTLYLRTRQGGHHQWQ